MRKGSHITEETRQRMSFAQKGRYVSEEHKQKIAKATKRNWSDPIFREMHSGKNNGMYGKHHSDETKKKIAITKIGIYDGENNPMYGKHHSEDTKQKISESHLKEKHYLYGKHIPVETRLKMSEALKGKKKSPEAIAKRSKTIIENGILTGANHPNWNKKFSNKTKQRISDALKRLYKDNPQLHGRYGKPAAHSKGTWFNISEHKKIWLRSSYEVRMVNVLQSLGIEWQYEPMAFPLETSTYRPDFYLPEYDMWLEIKGWVWPLARKKIKSFIEKYPEKNLRILYNADISTLEKSIENNDKIDITRIGFGDIE